MAGAGVAGWTVLLFLQAQGDLAGHAKRDLAAIEAAARDAGPGLVVSAEVDDGNGPPRRLRLWPSAKPLQVSGQAGAQDGARVSDRFRAFLAWGSAQKIEGPLLVAVWGHGKGFPKGLALDEHGDGIDPGELRAALSAVSARRGRPVDLLLLDACLMQSVEVLASLDGVARWVVGTPQIQGYGGLPYVALLKALSDDPKALARALPRLALLASRTAPPERAYDALFFALSAVDPSAVAHELLPALDALARALDAALAKDPALSLSLLRKLTDSPGFNGGTRDVGALLSVLGALRLEPLRAPLDRALAALDAAVLASEVGPQLSLREYAGAAAGKARAISVWAPDDAAGYEAVRADYANAPLHRSPSHWSAWLERLHAPGKSTESISPAR